MTPTLYLVLGAFLGIAIMKAVILVMILFYVRILRDNQLKDQVSQITTSIRRAVGRPAKGSVIIPPGVRERAIEDKIKENQEKGVNTMAEDIGI